MHWEAPLINRENRAEKLPKCLSQPHIFMLKAPSFHFLFLLYKHKMCKTHRGLFEHCGMVKVVLELILSIESWKNGELKSTALLTQKDFFLMFIFKNALGSVLWLILWQVSLCMNKITVCRMKWIICKVDMSGNF